MWIILLVLVLAVLIFLLINPIFGKERKAGLGGLVGFVSRGLDAGFKFSQIRMLWQAASLAGLSQPAQIYWSLDELDRCLQLIIDNHKLLKEYKPGNPINELLKKLFEYRKKVEFNRPHYRAGIQTTRDIPINQKIKIRDNQLGIYDSQIVSNADRYMVIEYPKGDPLPLGFSWRNRVLNIYFWREGDAGYFFETKLREDYIDREEHKHLHLIHSDYLLRSQKRRSVRAPADFPAQLYRLKSPQSFSNFYETNPGIYCRIINISEDGLAIRISGRAKKNMSVKVQFNIGTVKAVMNGVIRSYYYDRGKDQSEIHVEAVPPLEVVRLAILAYVYDVDRSRYRKQKAMEEQVNKNLAQRKDGLTDIPNEIDIEPIHVEELKAEEMQKDMETEIEELEELDESL